MPHLSILDPTNFQLTGLNATASLFEFPVVTDIILEIKLFVLPSVVVAGDDGACVIVEEVDCVAEASDTLSVAPARPEGVGWPIFVRSVRLKLSIDCTVLSKESYQCCGECGCYLCGSADTERAHGTDLTRQAAEKRACCIPQHPVAICAERYSGKRFAAGRVCQSC
jgi:hypothetical protein